MKRKNPLLMVVGIIVSLVVTVMFAVMTWSYINWNKGKPLTTLAPQGPNSSSIASLANPVFLIAMFVFIAVPSVIFFIIWKFRDRGDEETADIMPDQLHGKTGAEIAWTIAPAVVLLGVALATVVTISDLNAAPKPDALYVKVEGQQWWWRFSYDLTDYRGAAPLRRDRVFTDPEDVVTADELVIPAGIEVALTETSNDVIHSFWIPALNGKKDAVPGMSTEWKLQANTPGVYRGQCTEFCGLSHGNMRMLVRAVSLDDFNTWKANQLKASVKPDPGSTAAAGEAVFKGQLCSSCHLIRGVNDEQVNNPKTGVKTQLVSGVAPDLTHFATRGTFSGSIFNSRYPNPEGSENAPFGQTCTVPNEKGSETDAQGKPLDVSRLPPCPPANAPDTLKIPFASSPGNPDNPPNKTALAEWLRDPTKLKPMSPLPEENPYAGGRRRGMPNLKLSEDQINQLVTYLNTLK